MGRVLEVFIETVALTASQVALATGSVSFGAGNLFRKASSLTQPAPLQIPALTEPASTKRSARSAVIAAARATGLSFSA